ncbi:MAG TPA: response regulator [Roseomonas sp.]|nr:response regulator [Roseomonas sp.]
MALSPEEAEGLLGELCRYARAAAGSTVLAEQVVEAALRRLLELAPRASDPPPRLHLFQAVQDQLARLPPLPPTGDEMTDLAARLADAIQAPAPSGEAAEGFTEAWLRRRLRRLAPVRREVLLLHHLMGFEPASIAAIIRRSVPAVEGILRASWKELSPPAQADILIIEDETLIALDLSMLMRDLGHKVRGIAADRAEAEALLKQGIPDLILSDLRLGLRPDEGRQIVAALRGGATVPVVYVTACPEDVAGEAEDGRPVFVVPKPFCALRLSMAVCDALAAGPRSGRLN